jgi:exodeoxyribonuclease VII small subunit
MPANNNHRNSSSLGAHGDNGATFEQRFARLQEVVQRLSEGNLSLREALSSFEEGMTLADTCSQMLEEAELRVKQVSDKAMRAGSASVGDLEADIRNGATIAPEGLVAIEFESFESTLLIEKPQPTPMPSAEPEPRRGAVSPPSKPTLLNDLDPLFDDED